MKKIISVIMIPVLLLCAFSVPAFAAGEEEELPLNSDVGLHLFYGSDDEPALLRIGLGNDFTGFGENVSVELIPTDPEEHASPKKYEKSDMIFAEDQMRFCRKDDEPAIYIKYPDMRSFFAVIGENSLVDSEGNGNSAFRTCEVDACEILADFDYSTNYGSKYGNNYYWKEGRSFIGDSVFISTYVDNETVEGELYLVNDNGIKTKEISVVLGILESLDVLSFKMIGGESSQLYIYINQIQSLINIINSPWRYDNRLLDTVGERHLVSVKMLTYLYEGDFTSDEIWDIIENYFLGIIPETVKKNCKLENPSIDI